MRLTSLVAIGAAVLMVASVSPLSDERRQLFGAFAQAGAQTFGADGATMDGYIQQVAPARMQELATKGEAARLIELAFDWDRAFATVRFQASAAAANYFSH